ncbi:MAG TPA: 50S ribosomal protein L7/L12 [Solirubrobacteraceae bacterium]|nr:50S ribosomal protein L7/L12 [Solirubrobacteraceae bacterium]
MSDDERIRRLEQQVDHLYRHLGLAPLPGAGAGGSTSADAELLALVDDGKKIHAIKRYRELTGVGLKEASDAVDELERRYRLA